MQAYIAKRMVLFVPTMILLSLLVFGFLRIIPGDPALAILTRGNADSIETITEDQLERMRERLGTNRPIYVQYFDWASGLLTLDFGNSLVTSAPVWEQLKRRIPITLELSIMSIFISTIVAVPLGVFSAIKQDTWGDYIARFITLIGLATPNFWVAVMTIFILVLAFNWIPPLGYATLWEDPWTNFVQLIFPAIALGTSGMAFQARVTRSAMLEILHEDYIRTARSKGLHERLVVSRHALRNALLPVVTLFGLAIGNAISGSVVIEFIFGVPGMGRFLITAIRQQDYTVVQGIVVVFGVMVLFANLITDIMYAWLDPRIRYG
jgi:peptide/nickel transport system permease protein